MQHDDHVLVYRLYRHKLKRDTADALRELRESIKRDFLYQLGEAMKG